jgi:hypothetical protein
MPRPRGPRRPDRDKYNEKAKELDRQRRERLEEDRRRQERINKETADRIAENLKRDKELRDKADRELRERYDR